MTGLWTRSWRADPRGAALADRHYDRQKIGAKQFVPPGSCVVWAGAWINSLFRNEGAGLSSALIRAAVRASIDEFAAKGVAIPWRGMVTFVDSRKVRSRNPGYCFKVAGFIRVGETKDEGLLAFALHPSRMPGLPSYVPSSDAQPARMRGAL